jgi:hypothetical protein
MKAYQQEVRRDETAACLTTFFLTLLIIIYFSLHSFFTRHTRLRTTEHTEIKQRSNDNEVQRSAVFSASIQLNIDLSQHCLAYLIEQ